MAKYEEFLLKCYNKMMPNYNLWFAFQSNCLTDVGSGYSKEWKTLVEKSKENLEDAGFVVSTMPNNFRNADQVFKAAKELQPEGIDASLQEVLNDPSCSTPTTMNSELPVNIVCNFKDKETLFKEVIYSAINRMQDDPLCSEPSCVVILHDFFFTTKEIYDVVCDLVKTDDLVTTYPTTDAHVHPTLAFQNFLKDPKGYIIMVDSLFNGSEAENVIYASSSSSTSNLRCSLLRAVARLCVVQLIYEGNQFMMPNAKLDDKYLTCQQECYMYMFECTTCHEALKECGETAEKERFLVCGGCKIKCHKGHSLKGIKVAMLGVTKCMCTTCSI